MDRSLDFKLENMHRAKNKCYCGIVFLFSLFVRNEPQTRNKLKVVNMHVAFLSENLHASHARLQLPPTIIISFDKMKRIFF
jgi:hypothetical protein